MKPAQAFADTIEIVNYIFLGIFTIEAIVKTIGFGFRLLERALNKFDLVVVIASLAGLFLQTFNLVGTSGVSTSVIRVFRIVRLSPH